MRAVRPRPPDDGGAPLRTAPGRDQRWLLRRRLLDALDGAIDSGLALVVAPPGSGKTTLLQQWALGRAGPVHWPAPTLDEVDRLSRSPLHGATVLLDDAQRLGRRATSSLVGLIEHSSPTTTFVVAARSIPAFNLARAEFPDPVLVTHDDLRFRASEIADLFEHVYDAPITGPLAHDLARTTGGWAAALHLQRLSELSRGAAHGRSTGREPRDALPVDQTYTSSYLAQEVLAPLPPALVHFLQLTCVLDPLSVGECDLLLSWDGSAGALRELVRRSGLVSTDPDAVGVFHCHPVLRAHLRAQLTDTVGSRRALELISRAAQLSAFPEPAPPHASRSPSFPATRPARRQAHGDRDRLEVHCLGGFRFHAGGHAVDLAQVRPSALTVLRILAVNAGAPVHREQLVELLWPDRSAEAAVHNLHVAVSSLRRCLESAAPGRGRALLSRCGDAYVFAPDLEPVTDIQLLERTLQGALQAAAAGDQEGQLSALRAALELYAGDVLPGDGPAEWVVDVRERLRRRAARAAGELAAVELGRGNVAAAVAPAIRSVELDPWNDEAWRQLIHCHHAAGDHAQAARARQSYHRRLQDLGVEAGEAGEARRPVADRAQDLRKSSTSPSATRWERSAPYARTTVTRRETTSSTPTWTS
jgi:DNA-binding SARP family transcriptional activator